jgi:hypothetical protein
MTILVMLRRTANLPRERLPVLAGSRRRDGAGDAIRPGEAQNKFAAPLWLSIGFDIQMMLHECAPFPSTEGTWHNLTFFQDVVMRAFRQAVAGKAAASFARNFLADYRAGEPEDGG